MTSALNGMCVGSGSALYRLLACHNQNCTSLTHSPFDHHHTLSCLALLIQSEYESSVLHCSGFHRSGPPQPRAGKIARSVSVRARCVHQDGEPRLQIQLLHAGFLRRRRLCQGHLRRRGSPGGGGATRFQGLLRRERRRSGWECRRDPVQVGELREGVEIEVVRVGRWSAFVLQDSRTGQDLDESGEG